MDLLPSASTPPRKSEPKQAVIARQLSAEAKRGNDLERQLALATSRVGGDATSSPRSRKTLRRQRRGEEDEARFNARESGIDWSSGKGGGDAASDKQIGQRRRRRLRAPSKRAPSLRARRRAAVDAAHRRGRADRSNTSSRTRCARQLAQDEARVGTWVGCQTP